MADGVFRNKVGFTAVQNYITRDKNVSLKAKGLYLVIQSYITLHDKTWRKSDFFKMTMEGEKAFNNAWDELKEKGYLHVHMYSDGRSWRVEYELLEEAQDGAHTFYYSSDGTLKSTNIDRAKKKKQPENDENFPLYRFGSNGNGTNGNGTNGNGSNGIDSNGIGSNGIGSNDIGSNGIGTSANGDNNNKPININLIHNTSYNPSINHKETKERRKQKSRETHLMLNLDEQIDYSQILSIEQIHLAYGKIPNAETEPDTTIISLIQYLCGWNYFRSYNKSDPFAESIYMLIVTQLCEMVTARKPMIILDTEVTAQNVIDKINRIIVGESCWDFALHVFVDMSIRKLKKKLTDRKVENIPAYINSVLWNMFDTYQVDFNAFYERTYNEGLAE